MFDFLGGVSANFELVEAVGQKGNHGLLDVPLVRDLLLQDGQQGVFGIRDVLLTQKREDRLIGLQ